MIETLACFRYGQWTTHSKGDDSRWQNKSGWRYGKTAFKDFLEDPNNCFNAAGALFQSGDGIKFYTEIRCGILHQAETKGGWRILRNGPAVNRNSKTINAGEFLNLLKHELNRYSSDLRDEMNPANIDLWKACRYKLLGICANSGWPKIWPLDDAGSAVNWAVYS